VPHIVRVACHPSPSARADAFDFSEFTSPGILTLLGALVCAQLSVALRKFA
jgi:hypothetical protein